MKRERFDLDAIKRAISVPSVLAAHGLPAARRGACPIHGGDNRSAFVCDDERWHCWTQCGGGDVIALVEKLHGFSFVEATTWLATLAGLKLPGDTPIALDAFPDVEVPARAAMLAEVSGEWHAKLDELNRLHEELDWLDLRWKEARGGTSALVAAFMRAIAKPTEVANA
jgi:phage/plasmid primase-like uncharacterized protein